MAVSVNSITMRFRHLLYGCFLAMLLGSHTQIRAADITIAYGNSNLSFDVLASDSSSCILPFNRVGNLIVLKAKVDTMEGNFILDTGAPHLVLNLTYFRDYPIEVQQDGEQSSIAGRGDQIYKTQINELIFGAMLFHRLQADVTNLGNIENARGLKVLGLLGLDLFRRCEMIVDFEKSQIFLHRIGKQESKTYRHALLDDTSLYRVFPIEFSGKRMFTQTEVAGKKLKLVIDCAAESNILDSRLPEKILELITITRRVKLAGPGDRKADALYGNLASMKMGTRQIENLPVIIINLEYTCFNDDMCINGVLGFEFCRSRRSGLILSNAKCIYGSEASLWHTAIVSPDRCAAADDNNCRKRTTGDGIHR